MTPFACISSGAGNDLMRQGIERAPERLRISGLRSIMVVVGLVLVLAADALAQGRLRRPQRPSRPARGNPGAPAAGNPPRAAADPGPNAAPAAATRGGTSGSIKNLAGENTPAPELWK